MNNDNPTKFLVKSNAWTEGWGNHFKAYLFVNPKHIVESPIAIFCDAEYHKADSEEIERFYEILHKHHKDWDSKKKQLVNWKWKPKQGDDYYYINSIGRVLRSELYSCGIDKCETFFGFGNYFQTEEEAKAMAERIRKILNGK